MSSSPQRQAILSLVPRLTSFETDGNRVCYTLEEGRALTFLGISGQNEPWPSFRPDGDDVNPGCMTLSLGGSNPEVAVFRLCQDGETPVPPLAGEFNGAVLLRDARPDELSLVQQQIKTPAETVIGLQWLSDNGREIILKASTESAAYLLTF